MGRLGELFEQRSDLLKQKTELSARLSRIRETLQAVANVLDNLDGNGFHDAHYHDSGRRALTQFHPEDVNADEILKLHSDYATACRELAGVEAEVEQHGGKW